MEFRRIPGLPPYVFTIIDGLKQEARRAGRDVVDLGFGNPDLPSPDIAVEKLAEAAHNSRNHRYSASRGIPKLRQAVAALYLRKFGVTLDPETEVLSTIGAKEGFSHLMWVLLQPGDAALVPSPVLPHPHLGPLLRRCRCAAGPGRHRRGLRRERDGGLGARLAQAAGGGAVVPAQPDHGDRRAGRPAAAGRLGPRARRGAGARLRLRRRRVRRLAAAVDPAVRGREGVRGRALLDDQVVLDGRLAGGLPARQRGGRRRAHQAEVLPRLRHLPADPDRGHGHDERGAGLPGRGQRGLRVAAQRAGRRAGPDRLGGRAAARHDVRLGADPRALRARWARSSSPP